MNYYEIFNQYISLRYDKPEEAEAIRHSMISGVLSDLKEMIQNPVTSSDTACPDDQTQIKFKKLLYMLGSLSFETDWKGRSAVETDVCFNAIEHWNPTKIPYNSSSTEIVALASSISKWANQFISSHTENMTRELKKYKEKYGEI